MSVNAVNVNGAAVNATAGASSVIYPSTELTNPVVTYTFTITGTPDVTVPVSSIQIRRTATDEYLAVTVPSVAYIDVINARLNGQMSVTRTQTDAVGNVVTSVLITTAITNLNSYKGSVNQSITIDGHATPAAHTAQNRTITGATYRSTVNGSRRYRSRIDNYLRPGDVAYVDDESLTVAEIVSNISENGALMEFAE